MSVFDVSRYQPEDRLQELADGGNCDGVIIKLGEWYNKDNGGEIDLDPMFIIHVNEAVRLGIPYGLYFMSRAENAEEAMHEAQWVNDRVAELLRGEEPKLGLWFDLERQQVKRDDIYSDIKEVIETFKAWWNTKHVGIYASYSYFYDYLDVNDMRANNTPIWLAQYNGTNGMLEDGYPNVVAWQFTTNGNYQDENVWYGFKE